MATTLLNCEVELSNPKLGDIIPARLLGIKDRSGSRIWAECIICGQERWTSVLAGEPRHKFCQKCGWSRRQLRTGGRYKSSGYIWARARPEDKYYSMANKNGYIAEHRLIVAQNLHRPLKHYEIVHHKNHIRDDNRLENLTLLSSKSQHFVDLKLYEYIEQLEEENEILRRTLKCLQPS